MVKAKATKKPEYRDVPSLITKLPISRGWHPPAYFKGQVVMDLTIAALSAQEVKRWLQNTYGKDPQRYQILSDAFDQIVGHPVVAAPDWEEFCRSHPGMPSFQIANLYYEGHTVGDKDVRQKINRGETVKQPRRYDLEYPDPDGGEDQTGKLALDDIFRQLGIDPTSGAACTILRTEEGRYILTMNDSPRNKVILP